MWLYDTFEGMPRPTAKDVAYNGIPAESRWQEEGAGWCLSPLEEVRANMESTGYPSEQIRLVAGMVEDTIPDMVPDRIAVLRLDTDWFESTYHELVYLFPRLVPGGVLIIDDYGHWQGAREATDKYFEEAGITMLLQRTDYTGRMGIRAC